ncbi:MAG: hypothetical protein VX909_02110, partial [Candidatus Thermoplasmatota archaeon]|nr:hypothetical protein [Candidatus Thermoplasmatota archaeon]
MQIRDTSDGAQGLLPAIFMVALMMLSTQLLMFLGEDDEGTTETGLEKIPKRTSYQQLDQISGPAQGANNNQPAAT